MNKQNSAIVAAIGFLAFLTLAYFAYLALGAGYGSGYNPGADADETAHSLYGSVEPYNAPSFIVKDASGAPAALSDFAGKPVVLNFWASWCPPCKAEMPYFNEAYQKYGGDIQFLMVNQTDGSRETLDTAASFIRDKGYGFPIFYDTTFSAAFAYNVQSIPSTFFIDSSGKVVAVFSGSMSKEKLEANLGRLQ